MISCDHSDSNTLAEGFGRKASDKAFVSRTIIRNLGAHALVRVLAGTFLRRQRFDSPSDRIGQVFVGGGVLSKHRAQDVAHFVLHRTVPVGARARAICGFRASSRLRIVMLAISSAFPRQCSHRNNCGHSVQELPRGVAEGARRGLVRTSAVRLPASILPSQSVAIRGRQSSDRKHAALQRSVGIALEAA